MITICLVYFRSLALANLAAALYSVKQQDLSQVREVIVVDNNTDDDITEVVTAAELPSVRMFSYKHGDPTLTHAWSTNTAIEHVKTDWLLFTRADYLLDAGLVQKFLDVRRSESWRGFVCSNGSHLHEDIAQVERTDWRRTGVLPRGLDFDHTVVDAGVWMARREDVINVGGLNEEMTAWGHAQTEFQYRLHQSGVEFLRIPEVLFVHPRHAGERDMAVANKQLAAAGVNLQDAWKRYHGEGPYR